MRPTQEQVQERVLAVVEELAARQGRAALTARNIARACGYTPGNLYNLFRDLDDLRLRVEARVLARLQSELLAAVSDLQGTAAVDAYTTAYIRFVKGNGKLWTVIAEARDTDRGDLPEWYRQRLEALAQPLKQQFIVHQSGDTRYDSAAVALWSVIHGISALAASGKSPAALNGAIEDHFIGLSRAAFVHLAGNADCLSNKQV